MVLVDSEGCPVAKVAQDTLQPGLFYNEVFDFEYGELNV